jgi:hypothetical protein
MLLRAVFLGGHRQSERTAQAVFAQSAIHH